MTSNYKSARPEPRTRILWSRVFLAAAVVAAIPLGIWQMWPDQHQARTNIAEPTELPSGIAAEPSAELSSELSPSDPARAPALEPAPEPSKPATSRAEPQAKHEQAMADPVATLVPKVPEVPAPIGELREFELAAGQTLVGALKNQGISQTQAGQLALALEKVFEARKLRAGQAFELTVTTDDGEPRIESLAFRVALDTQIVVEQGQEGFVAEEREVPHTRMVDARTLVVSGSLAAAAAEANVPQEPILEIVQQLGYRVDFTQDLRAGDRIDLTYERFVHPEDGVEHIGGLLSARLQLGDKEPIEIYRYKTADGIISFFDSEGVSIETELARTPVVGGYLTSSYGPRKHPVLNVNRMHKGMDFAAPKGAAVVAVQAGRVVRARRNGSFGKYIRISHGKGLETAYAHLSEYRKKLSEGVWVKKGEVIGYVGESGLATSPNLHYEVLRNGDQVNPRSVDLPPRLRLKDKELARFEQLQQDLQLLFTEKGDKDHSTSG